MTTRRRNQPVSTVGSEPACILRNAMALTSDSMTVNKGHFAARLAWAGRIDEQWRTDLDVLLEWVVEKHVGDEPE